MSALDATDVLVMVGDGRKAHVYRSAAGVDFKLTQLEDGATVFDVALCGAGGGMVVADDDTAVCGHCRKKVAAE